MAFSGQSFQVFVEHSYSTTFSTFCSDSYFFRKVPDYSPVISRYERLIHDPHNPTKLTTFYALKLARFHARVRNDRKLAEKILKDAINRDKVCLFSNTSGYLAI